MVGRPALGRHELAAAGNRQAAGGVELDGVLEQLRRHSGHGRERYRPGVRPTPVLGFGAMRLRPLTEAECYARCYGGHRSERVSVVRFDGRRSRRSVRSGEAIRALFEDRLDVRPTDAEAA